MKFCPIRQIFCGNDSLKFAACLRGLDRIPSALNCPCIKTRNALMKNAHRAVISRPFSTHKVSKRVRLRATGREISDSELRIFRADGYKGRDLRRLPARTRADYFLSLGLLRAPCMCIHDTPHTCTRAYKRKHPRPLPSSYNLCACILCDKSASSLCQSAVTRFAPVGMRESCRLQGGRRKSLTFDSASCIAG